MEYGTEDNVNKCPFCGGDAFVDFSEHSRIRFLGRDGYPHTTEKLFVVKCSLCGSSTGNYEDVEDAIAAWNG